MKFRALLLLSLLSCGDPVITEYEPRTGIITGTLFYPAATLRGNVIIFLFRTSRLPPPQGDGAPVNFIVVSKEALFGDAGPETKDFAAPFVMPNVPPGRYQLRAFLDADGDFLPAEPLLAQPTAGDLAGGHIDLTTRDFLPVEVSEDEETSQVIVSLGTVLPVERPVFSITSSTTFTVPLARPQSFRIRSLVVERERFVLDPARTRFLVQVIDADKDGIPDDTNQDGLIDVYPRVFLRRLEQTSTENQIIVPLLLDPTPFLADLAATGFTTTTDLSLTMPPFAVERSSNGDVVLASIPAGDYETIVVLGTGQTWQVPNTFNRVFSDGNEPTQAVRIRVFAGASLREE